MSTHGLMIKIPESTAQKTKPKGRPKKTSETRTPISDASQEVKTHLSNCILQLIALFLLKAFIILNDSPIVRKSNM